MAASAWASTSPAAIVAPEASSGHAPAVNTTVVRPLVTEA